jgi:hypothetical protein
MSRISGLSPAQVRPTYKQPTRQKAPNLQPLPTDSVRFGHSHHKNASKTHPHGGTCCKENSHACPSEPHEHDHTHDHAHPAKPKEANWFSRFFSGLKNDIQQFYQWLKKLFSGKQ